MQAGKGPSAHLIGVWDINHRDGPFESHVATFRQAARDHAWACVVEGGRSPLKNGVEANYRFDRRIAPIDRKAMMNKTGWRVRPEAIHVPR